MSEEKRKILSTFEWIMFVLGIGIIAYVMLQKGDFKMMEKKETVEIVNNPNKATQTKRNKSQQLKKKNHGIEAVLKELAWKFSKDEKKGEVVMKTTSKTEIPKDEMRYYKKVKDKYRFEDQLKDAQDWYQILKRSRSTYHKLKDVFSEASGQAPQELNNGSVDHVVENTESADNLYHQLRRNFQISEEEAKAFAQKGQHTLSDWARFVEDAQK